MLVKIELGPFQTHLRSQQGQMIRIMSSVWTWANATDRGDYERS